MRALTPLVALALLAGLACNDASSPDDPQDWGGPEATLSLSLAGGSVVYLCGTSTIDPGWGVARGGLWHGTGQYFPGGGPLPPGGRPPHPATYDGVFQGDALTFTVFVPDLETTLGPYTVTRGKPGASEICL